MPEKLFSLGMFHINDDDNRDGSLRMVLNEGKRSKIYDFDYVDYEPLPSTLKITVCPENDINADGSFNEADVVELQKYLLGKNDTDILNWRVADICSDGILDVFDLVAMRKALIAATGMM
ncbi:MAG: dockerin type I repeat-containing protein [Ruminococcus sp.]|nr:dockerin type I repeat-containing protein [Ruminococcus sp.]